jgi:hypothetical protein
VTRRSALLTTVFVVLALGGAVVGVSDAPVSDRAVGAQRTKVAALAVRDHVVPFQKWGTKMFTLPALEEHYDEVAYFTQRWPRDRTTELLTSLTELLRHHDQVDVFVLAHSNALFFDVASIEPELTRKLRLVYDTGCSDAHQAGEWVALGADVHVGHPGATSVSPVFYFYFLRRWLRGWSANDAVQEANRKTRARLRWVSPLAESFVGPVDLVESTRAVVHGEGQVSLWR